MVYRVHKNKSTLPHEIKLLFQFEQYRRLSLSSIFYAMASSRWPKKYITITFSLTVIPLP